MIGVDFQRKSFVVLKKKIIIISKNVAETQKKRFRKNFINEAISTLCFIIVWFKIYIVIQNSYVDIRMVFVCLKKVIKFV